MQNPFLALCFWFRFWLNPETKPLVGTVPVLAQPTQPNPWARTAQNSTQQLCLARFWLNVERINGDVQLFSTRHEKPSCWHIIVTVSGQTLFCVFCSSQSAPSAQSAGLPSARSTHNRHHRRGQPTIGSRRQKARPVGLGPL